MAIVANAAIALGKFLVVLLTGSSAMLAEAFHSTVDTVMNCSYYWGRSAVNARPMTLIPLD